MAACLKNGFCSSGSNEIGWKKNMKRITNNGYGVSSSKMGGSLQFTVGLIKNEFKGTQLEIIPDKRGLDDWSLDASLNFSVVRAQSSICVSRAMRWWDKTLKSNVIEIHSAQELVETLANAGDTLVIIDVYSPGCGGCKALHPKICQLVELNPNALFLKVNHDELKTTCYSLNIHVLPFFKFYRGAQGRLCSFSCTVATIKKFKDALAKHGTDRCSLGPAKGLEESELLKLASNGGISFDCLSRFTSKETMENIYKSSNSQENMNEIVEGNLALVM